LATSYQVDANGNVYTVVNDCTTVYRVVVAGSATDEIFGTLFAPGFAAELQRKDLGSKAFDNGLYALSGYPESSFPHLDTTSYTVDYVLSAPGFRDLPLTALINVGAVFPVPGPAAAMRRLPVRIQGRVVNSSNRQPISGALVAGIDNPATPSVHTTTLRTPLYFAHASGVSVRNATVTAGGSATLSQPVNGGDRAMVLSTRTGLAHGSVLRLTGGGGVQVEYVIVDDPGPTPLSAQGEVSLIYPPNRSYPVGGTAVDFVTVTATGAMDTLSSDADDGDGVLLASLLFTQTLVVEAGTALEEAHEPGALTDNNGYYALDGICRVQELLLRATQGALKQTVDWFVEFDQPLNLVDFRM
jgi:hypothetical protein